MAASDLRKVLYIEDDPQIRGLVELTLEETGGLKVVGCGSWREALVLAREEAPDLFLLDVMLPEKDGVATLAELRALPGMAHTPAIFLTVDTALATADTAGLGPHAVIPKPFQPAKLYPRLLAHWQELTA